jgi:hypothetical protein
MKWQNSVAGVVVLGLTIFSLVGCSTADEPAVVTTNPAVTETTTTQSTPQITPTLSAATPSTSPSAAPQINRPSGAPPTGNPPSGTPGTGPVPPTIDYAAAATKLGVTEDALKTALGSDSQKAPDWAAAAKTLGVSEESLQAALGFSAGGPPGGNPPAGIPPGANTGS